MLLLKNFLLFVVIATVFPSLAAAQRFPAVSTSELERLTRNA